jgi:hypothetical protein
LRPPRNWNRFTTAGAIVASNRDDRPFGTVHKICDVRKQLVIDRADYLAQARDKA